MERRDFLKFALGVAASAAALSARAQAAPLAPHSLNDDALRAASPETPIPLSPPKTKSIISSRNKCVGVTVMAGAMDITTAGATVIGAHSGIAVTGAGTVAGIVIIGAAATGTAGIIEFGWSKVTLVSS